MRTVRSATQIRDLLQQASAACRECDDCYLGIVRIDPDAGGCNWAIAPTPLWGDRDACTACLRAVSASARRLRETLALPVTDLSMREIETLQGILAVRELGIGPARHAGEPRRAVERGYAFVASDGRLDVSREGRELLRRL